MFDLKFKVEHAKNKATKRAIIEEDEMNLKISEQKREKQEYKQLPPDDENEDNNSTDNTSDDGDLF